jgi:hypothetical protein
MNGYLKENKMKKSRNRKSLTKEQVRDVKVQGLPNPAELASRISSSGASSEEILGWLGAVLSRAGMAPSATSGEVAVEDTTVLPPPTSSPAAIEEKFERKLLDSLLRDVNRSVRKK